MWNVLKGDMSLVGPRPVTREELLRYGRNAVIYEMVRPGLTGLWQVSGRNFVEYRKRVAMDVVLREAPEPGARRVDTAEDGVVVVTGPRRVLSVSRRKVCGRLSAMIKPDRLQSLRRPRPHPH